LGRVFVINQPMRHDRDLGILVPYLDLSRAEEHGVLEFVLPDGELRGSSEKIASEIEEGLKDFTVDDFILLVGDPRTMAYGAAVAVERTGGELPLLRYLKTLGRYSPSRVDVSRCCSTPSGPRRPGPPVVYVVNKPLKQDFDGSYRSMMDISPAAEYGRLEYVLPDGELQGTSSEEIVRELHDGLRGMREIDHIVPVGDPRAIAWAGAVASKILGGALPLLHWVRNMRRYQPFRVSLRGGKVQAS